MKGQDIVVLLKLVSLHRTKSADELGDCTSARALAAELGISKSEVNVSIRRSIEARLAHLDWDSKVPVPNQAGLCEFIIHGLRYVFPASLGALGRGVPTAFAGPSLSEKILSNGELPPIWLSPTGSTKGQAVTPLYKSVPQAVQSDTFLYDTLTLIDAIRIGRARERAMAIKLIEEKIKDG